MEKSLLLETYLKQFRLPAVGRHYQEVARQAVLGNFSYEAFLLALVERETQQREENAHQKRLRLARFPVVKTLDQFDFTCVPSLNKAKVLSLAQGEYLDRHENLILMGNSVPARPIWPRPWGSWPATRARKCGSSRPPV